jgi:hypothetical protein
MASRTGKGTLEVNGCPAGSLVRDRATKITGVDGKLRFSIPGFRSLFMFVPLRKTRYSGCSGAVRHFCVPIEEIGFWWRKTTRLANEIKG